jgi:hypothetical protein
MYFVALIYERRWARKYMIEKVIILAYHLGSLQLNKPDTDETISGHHKLVF